MRCLSLVNWPSVDPPRPGCEISGRKINVVEMLGTAAEAKSGQSLPDRATATTSLTTQLIQ